MCVPLVSVIVPCYNHSKFVETCILSVINQTYKNIELIVIDDGSTDNSFEVLTQLRKKYVFHLERQTNMGLCKTLNKAIKLLAKGDFIACLASDDYWANEKIDRQIEVFIRQPELGFIFTKAMKFNTSGIISEIPIKKRIECNFGELLLDDFVPALTVLAKRHVIIEMGGYDENLYFEDWDMWLKIANKYPFHFIPINLAFYRIHSTNMSSNYYKMIEAQKIVVDRWKGCDFYPKAHNNIVLYEIAINSVLNKKVGLMLMLKHYRLILYFDYLKSIIRLIFKFHY
ncbi:glycosyltransferase family 2 protein [Arcticibacter eurypsychrophilus]|uniref:glycosyltransferase family 2 protein n=1 Tax=Arcticibacter eurypsychrophilus TaxID=1434752 RepID=UPI00084DEB06|nr:glycosyltransferase [Arcticibacter eurypsychrophilus]